MKDKNPLSPHIQIYNWHISSLVSISHRISGVINFLVFILICLWIALLFLGNSGYDPVFNILNSNFGKFIVLGITWSFTFQVLSLVRHFFWDMGYGFDLKIANLTGSLVIIGSFLFTILIYIIGRQII
ncbi:MAG: succinate dehydrogenase, cytochrome b556 subunit [Pelagibacteraceae bacterium]|tara:strand:- start:826 stop:1209 length:384 start_codon:yes stop_codon:yes gene_type:complete